MDHTSRLDLLPAEIQDPAAPTHALCHDLAHNLQIEVTKRSKPSNKLYELQFELMQAWLACASPAAGVGEKPQSGPFQTAVPAGIDLRVEV